MIGTREQIEMILNKKVRPALAKHEGNVTVLSLENNILKVRLTGKCSGCPAASRTSEELIAAEIKAAIPSVADVVLVEDTSQELLDEARKLLGLSS
ncbi:NifU family protein [Lacrimispora sp.]|uniref:NifU family protein n=1 Tax=Lacrimispora sp. TaxID=2719234 RepID=UPI00289EA81D|nr:NifU family protein [Lacrimispora sp.]